MIQIKVNGKWMELNAPEDKPLLYVLREDLGLTGTKYGCGIGECGHCLVHVDGEVERSCQVSLKDVKGKHITTIEGLAPDHPLKQAWLAEQVPQCGYCQPGQIMRAAALLNQEPEPNQAAVADAMAEVLCRCGTYPRIAKAVRTASGLTNKAGEKS